MLAPRFGEPQAVPPTSGPVLELLPFWAAAVEPRLGGPLMRELAAAPLAGLPHVKRVRKRAAADGRPAALEILLCRTQWQQEGEQQQQQEQAANGTVQAAGSGGGGGGGEQAATAAGSQPAEEPPQQQQPPADAGLPPAIAALVQQHGLQPYLVQVPGQAPLTREQLHEWGLHWPLTWRPPDPATQPHLAQLSPAEVAAMQRHMAEAWRLAADGGAAGGVANACLIVDPARDAVVARAADARHRHPLQHAAMAAVAATAEWQLRVWPPEQPVAAAAAAAGTCNGATAGAAAAAAPPAAAATTPPPAAAGMVHGASAGALAELDGKRRRLDGSADVHDAAPAACAAAEASGQAQPSGAADEDAPPGQRPYLCTGYDAYMLHEPCVMCAMALVHSRLRRVVYCAPSPQGGALGGASRLHSHRSLNHRYTVYRLPLLSGDGGGDCGGGGEEGAGAG